jgi:hypothetical protein
MPMNPRLLRPLARRQASAPPFSPSSVAGLVGWYDASDLATLFQNSNGTGAVGGDDPVGYWQDKSGTGNHATQSGSTSLKPTLATASTNGKASLSFDNDSLQCLKFAANPLAGSAAGTAFYVCRGDLGEDACIGHPLAKFGDTVDADHYPCGGFDHYSSFGRDTRFSFSYDPPFTSTHVGVVMSRSADWRFWFKDTLATTKTGSAVSWGSFASIGGNGNESAAAFYYPGVVCEVLLYAAAVSDADRATITNYLVSKWGIA